MQDAQFLATVIEAASDPARKARIIRAIQEADRTRMGSVRDAAQILGVCTRSVERYAENGAFPRVHLSARKIRYPLDAVERFATHGAGRV